MTAVDGRVLRGERNREAIAEAMVACYEADILRPSAAEVARRAGVSARSVHNHFADMEALIAEVSRRQWTRLAHLIDGPDPDAAVAERVTGLVERRATLFETATPVRRAALLSVHDSPTIAANLARLDRMLRRQIEATFRVELTGRRADLLDALDALLSWDTWNRLRCAQGCSIARARRILVVSVTTLLKGTSP
jgi:AcrR family transcriptional regulator